MFVRGPFPEDYECEEKEDAASFFVVGGDAPLQPPPMRQESRNLLYFRAVSREGLRGEKRKRSGKVAGDIQVWRGGALKKMHFVGRRREWCKRVFGGGDRFVAQGRCLQKEHFMAGAGNGARSADHAARKKSYVCLRGCLERDSGVSGAVLREGSALKGRLRGTSRSVARGLQRWALMKPVWCERPVEGHTGHAPFAKPFRVVKPCC